MMRIGLSGYSAMAGPMAPSKPKAPTSTDNKRMNFLREGAAA